MWTKLSKILSHCFFLSLMPLNFLLSYCGWGERKSSVHFSFTWVSVPSFPFFFYFYYSSHIPSLFHITDGLSTHKWGKNLFGLLSSIVSWGLHAFHSLEIEESIQVILSFSIRYNTVKWNKIMNIWLKLEAESPLFRRAPVWKER